MDGEVHPEKFQFPNLLIHNTLKTLLLQNAAISRTSGHNDYFVRLFLINPVCPLGPQDPKLKEGNTLINYTEEQLIELWRKDNSFFINGLGEKMAKKYYLPKEKLLNLWNYQKEKETLNSCINGEDIFIPTMYPFVNNKTGEVFTAVIWGDCINQVIPECDFIIIGRNTEWWEHKLLKKPEKVFAINTYANVIDKMNPYLHPFQALISGLKIFRSTHEKVARSIFNNFFKEEEYHKFKDVSMLSINNIYDEL